MFSKIKPKPNNCHINIHCKGCLLLYPMVTPFNLCVFTFWSSASSQAFFIQKGTPYSSSSHTQRTSHIKKMRQQNEVCKVWLWKAVTKACCLASHINALRTLWFCPWALFVPSKHKHWRWGACSLLGNLEGHLTGKCYDTGMFCKASTHGTIWDQIFSMLVEKAQEHQELLDISLGALTNHTNHPTLGYSMTPPIFYYDQSLMYSIIKSSTHQSSHRL